MKIKVRGLKGMSIPFISVWRSPIWGWEGYIGPVWFRWSPFYISWDWWF